MTNNKEVRQQDLNRLVKLVSELVYYSQIYTVKGVIPVEMQSHEKSWREAQQWLWDNCESKDGEYYLPTPTDASSKVEGEDNPSYKALEDLWRDIDLITDYADFGPTEKYKMIEQRINSFNKTIKP